MIRVPIRVILEQFILPVCLKMYVLVVSGHFCLVQSRCSVGYQLPYPTIDRILFAKVNTLNDQKPLENIVLISCRNMMA